jgi:cytochrome c553
MVRRLKRGAVLIGLSAILGAAPALAQDNLDRGKTMQQVFATDCGICHGDASKVAASMQQRRLTAFLEQHYTTSKTIAAAIAGYLAAVAQGQRQPRPQRTRGRKSGTKKSN